MNSNTCDGLNLRWPPWPFIMSYLIILSRGDLPGNHKDYFVSDQLQCCRILLLICTLANSTTVYFRFYFYQREERETLNQLARQLASGSRLMAPMLQHLVYQHPGLSVPSSLQSHQPQTPSSSGPTSGAISLSTSHRLPMVADLSPKSSHSGDTPGSGHPADVHSPSLGRNNEAQSWTFEEQFRQVSSITIKNYLLKKSTKYNPTVITNNYVTDLSLFAKKKCIYTGGSFIS